MAEFPTSVAEMTAHEREVANLRYRTRNFTIAQLRDGRWAIFGPWWAYVSRSDAGLLEAPEFEPYAIFGHELEEALAHLNATWDFSVPERYRDRPKGALAALSAATDKSAEELGL